MCIHVSSGSSTLSTGPNGASELTNRERIQFTNMFTIKKCDFSLYSSSSMLSEKSRCDHRQILHYAQTKLSLCTKRMGLVHIHFGTSIQIAHPDGHVDQTSGAV